VSRLEALGEFVVERGERQVNLCGAATGETGEQIEIANNESGRGVDDDRVSRRGQNLETAAGEAELSFDGLVAVVAARKGDRGRTPAAAGQRFLQ
jgi:hypothetical protein